MHQVLSILIISNSVAYHSCTRFITKKTVMPMVCRTLGKVL